jgi:V/A-type H+-transporting ATPase subunit K
VSSEEEIFMRRPKYLFMSILYVLFPVVALAQESSVKTDSGTGLGYLAAAIAVGAGTVGAGIAVGAVGSAAMGVIGEKPELAGRALIFIGLAEGIAIYGLIVALMILARL